MMAIIKGSTKEAIQAAKNRDIPFFNACELDEGRSTCGHIPDSYADKVVEWFLESCGNKAPYPIGTCLYYRLSDSK